jgi:hypothetical protein
VAQAPENPSIAPAPQPPENPVIDGYGHTPQSNGRTPATPDPTFDELTPARLTRQQAQAERAALARQAPPPEPCPAWGDLSPALKAELVEMLTPYSDEPEPIVRRQVAWFRRGRGKERRTREEWQGALRGVIQDEIDMRLPVAPLKMAVGAGKGTNSIQIVPNWD